jgi:hypothetical protein
MPRLFVAVAMVAGVLVTGCAGGVSSPAAPTAVAGTAPPTTRLTGRWMTNGTPFMTLTQDGSAVSGTSGPVTLDLGGAVSVTVGIVTGTTSGANLNLRLQNTVTVQLGNDSVICRGADSFSGQQSGDTINGMLISTTTPYACDRSVPYPLPQLSAPMTLTRE